MDAVRRRVPREALEQLDKGLTYEPNEPKLLFMRREIGEALARETPTNKESLSPTVAPATSTTNPRVAA